MIDLQRQVQETLDRLVESGAETGVQVAVYRHGDLVVDAVAGVADVATGRLVTSDTPFFSASTGKAMASTVAHLLVERGAFGYDTPIVELWPEFGARGKQAATVRHVLTQTVGAAGVPADTTPAGEPMTADQAKQFEQMGKDVSLTGATIVQQCLRASLLDEITIHLVPVVLGRGVRLLDGLDPESVELELSARLTLRASRT